LAREWKVFRDADGTPLEQLTEARDWRLCEALLTLHAIADEACAGLGVALTASDGNASVYRARARELLARTGTLARIPTHLVRVLPKVRTSPSGSSSRALSRYACVHGPGVEACWHKVPGRRQGTDPRAQGANFLLLPWPRRVRESDFRPVEGSVRSLVKEPFGFFEFVPSEGLDLDLVDRMLIAAKDEVDNVDVVCLPESAVDESEIDELEALLHRHGVPGLVTGIRRRPKQPGQFPQNWVQIAQSTGEHWVRIRQNKHHRWSLDEEQINQYHLGGALPLISAGGKRWRCHAGPCSSSRSVRGSPSSHSCAKTSPRSTTLPTCFDPSARRSSSLPCSTDHNSARVGRHDTPASLPTIPARPSSL
jgi:hypothetical protein